MKRILAVALLLAGGALSLGACAAPGPYAYNGYGPYYPSGPGAYDDSSTCGVYGSCAPQGQTYAIPSNSQ